MNIGRCVWTVGLVIALCAACGSNSTGGQGYVSYFGSSGDGGDEVTDAGDGGIGRSSGDGGGGAYGGGSDGGPGEIYTCAAETQEKSAPDASCELPIPPSHQSFDLNRTRVTVTNGTGQATSVPQDPTCAGQGWHYDHTANPTKVDLCAATCLSFRSDNRAEVTAAFDCVASGDGGVVIH